MDGSHVLRRVRLAGGMVMALGLAMALCAAMPAGAAELAGPAGPSGAQTAAIEAAGSTGPQAGQVTEAGLSICTSRTHPLLAARISRGILAALRGRVSAVGLTVTDRVTGVTCKLHPHWHMDSASVVKVTILSALLRKLQEQHRSLTTRQRQLATAMITVSDNNAASVLWAQTGHPSLQRFLNLAGMRETQLDPDGFWGLTQITAHDEMTLLRLLTRKNTVLSTASRDFVLNLMARVIPSQRWGVPAGAPTSVTVHVKNGWLPQPTHGWRIHSIGSFSGRGRDYMIVVLTWNNPTMTYGVNTVQAVAEVINRALNPGVTSVIPPAKPYPSWGTPDEQIPPLAERT